MAFPTPVAIQRLGPSGEYFIDRRVQLKVVQGRVMVKRPGSHSTVYDSLSRYLVQLYAPLLGADAFAAADAAKNLSPERHHDAAVPIDAPVGPEHIRALRTEQRRLTEELAHHQALRNSHRSGLVSPARSGGSALNAQLQRSQRARVEEAILSPPPVNTVRDVGGVASMSEEEIELLKKLALAKQFRESRREQNIARRR